MTGTRLLVLFFGTAIYLGFTSPASAQLFGPRYDECGNYAGIGLNLRGSLHGCGGGVSRGAGCNGGFGHGRRARNGCNGGVAANSCNGGVAASSCKGSMGAASTSMRMEQPAEYQYNPPKTVVDQILSTSARVSPSAVKNVPYYSSVPKAPAGTHYVHALVAVPDSANDSNAPGLPVFDDTKGAVAVVIGPTVERAAPPPRPSNLMMNCPNGNCPNCPNGVCQ